MFTSNAKGCHSMIVLRDTVVSTRLSHVPCAPQCAPSLTLNFGWRGFRHTKSWSHATAWTVLNYFMAAT